MPTKTLLQLRTEVLQRANLENSDNFATSVEVTGLINDSVKAWRDMIIENRGQEFFTLDALIVLTGAYTYALPLDFYQILNVMYLDGTVYTPLRPFSFAEFTKVANMGGSYPMGYRVTNGDLLVLPPTASGFTLSIVYVPHFTNLVADGDTMEVFNGWSEWIVLDAAIKLLEKEGTDTTQLFQRLQTTTERLISQIQYRDRSFPETVADVEPIWRRGWY